MPSNTNQIPRNDRRTLFFSHDLKSKPFKRPQNSLLGSVYREFGHPLQVYGSLCNEGFENGWICFKYLFSKTLHVELNR